MAQHANFNFNPNQPTTNMPAMRAFPPEIRDAIIGEVASEAFSNSDSASHFRQTLFSFHAASTVTRSRALNYIYKKIIIYNDNRVQERIKTLRNLIESPSSIGNVDRFIKEMVFSFEMLPDPPVFLRRLHRPSPSSPEEIMKNEDLIFLLQSFRRKDYGLWKFTVKISPYDCAHHRSVIWTELTSTFQSAFQDLVRSPHLLSLRIRGISGMPVSVLGGSRLKNLVMHQISETEGEMDENSSKAYSSLESLSTNCVTLFSNLNQIPHAFQNLTELVFETRRSAPRVTLLPVLLHCGHNLLKLTLDILGPLEFDFQSLQIMPNLKAFTITCPTSRNSGSRVSQIQQVAFLLDVIQPMVHLEEVTLQLGLWSDVGLGAFMDITHPGWQMISTILSSAKYPNLRNVDVSIRALMAYLYFDEFDEEQFVREGNVYLSQQFRRLEESPNVSFKCKLICDSEILMGHRDDEFDD